MNQDPPPLKPLDLHVLVGFDDSGKQIANINIKFQLKSQKISAICEKCELKEPVGNDIIFKLDFVIQEGREKECLQYFENGLDQDEEHEYDYDLSPLQNWFKRPKKSGKLELYESNRRDGRGGVTLEYRFYPQAVEQDENIVCTMKSLQESNFHPDLNVNVRMLGRVQTFKKNRITIKPDQVDIHVTSEEFRAKDVQHFLELLEVFGEYEEEFMPVISSPIYGLLGGAEQIQGTFRLAKLGKMLELYEIGLNTNRDTPEREKEHPQILKGLFKSQLRITFIYANKIAFVADCVYENEAVLMRLLTSTKKYVQLFD